MRPSDRGAPQLGGLAAGIGLLAGSAAPSDGTEAADCERILALGDSYTEGTSVSNDEHWVTKLVETRRANGHPVTDPVVVAENGWTTGDLDEAIDDALAGRRAGGEDDAETDLDLTDEFDLVTLLIGANDCFQEQAPGTFHPTFVAVLDRAISFAPSPANVVVITVPDYTLTPVGQQNEPEEHASRLNAYNRIIEEEAAAAGTRFVDVVPPSKQVVGRPELIAEDDLHPSPEQYDRWLERLSPVAIEALKS
ncbi:MAG: GDSL-type esterase/lipase family protein [Halolamina sp.]|uniref:SGNH/GDSL hydrolase family protein n=1 Tax=Halolamina sp. TaxID=1940283 RepID=UPI002FC311AA